MTNQQITDLGAAGVPQDAIKRLSELQPGKAGSIFTSDLSVNEFLLVREVGFKPLGLVLGSSIYDATRFQNIKLRPLTEDLRKKNPAGADLARLNRLLLDDAFPESLSSDDEAQPFVPAQALANARSRSNRAVERYGHRVQDRVGDV